MKFKYAGKILQIEPGAASYEQTLEHFSDVYVLFEIDKTKIWTFMHGWNNYFPDVPYDKWKSSRYFPKLIGEEFEISLRFMDLKTEKIELEEKKLIPIQDQKKPCDYNLFGQVIEKKPHPKLDFAEVAYIDCGVIVETSFQKPNKFEVGDFVKINGRLDAFFLEDPKNKI